MFKWILYWYKCKDLLFKESSGSSLSQEQNIKPDPQDNPLLRFIGAVSHDALVQNIDEELYDQ
jgi:hypothetical protein